MQEYKELSQKVESALSDLHIKYRVLDLEDTDLNYHITISTIGKLKNLNTIDGLLYFQSADHSVNFFVANIFKIDNNDSILKLYDKINRINFSSPLGNYSIIETDQKQIVYKSAHYCGENFSNVNKELIQYIIVSFVATLIDLFDLLMEENNE